MCMKREDLARVCFALCMCVVLCVCVCVRVCVCACVLCEFWPVWGVCVVICSSKVAKAHVSS